MYVNPNPCCSRAMSPAMHSPLQHPGHKCSPSPRGRAQDTHIAMAPTVACLSHSNIATGSSQDPVSLYRPQGQTGPQISTETSVAYRSHPHVANLLGQYPNSKRQYCPLRSGWPTHFAVVLSVFMYSLCFDSPFFCPVHICLFCFYII